MLDVNEKNSWKSLGKFEATKVLWWQSRIDWVRCKESLLLCLSFGNWDLVYDILLSSVLYTNITKTEWNLLIHNHLLGICSTIHNINLGNDTDSTDTFLIKTTRHLKTIWVSHISISRQNSENNGTWITAVPCTHTSCDLLNVFWLLTYCNSSNTR